MKLPHLFKRIVIALAAVGVVMPNTGVALGSELPVAAERSKQATTVIDVALSEGGVLQGQVVNGNGVVQADKPVTIYQGKERVASTTTTKDGEFAVEGLRGGMYVVTTENAAGMVRAWTPKTAPPSAAKGVLLVPGNQIERGQMQGFMERWGAGAIIVGVFVGTVLIFALESDNAS